jgi:hypothetical protein
VKSKACCVYCEGFGDSGEESGETTRVTMKDSGNKVRDLGLYYEVFGENAGAAAMDMKTVAANYEKSGDAATAVSRPADRCKYEGFGGTPTPCAARLRAGAEAGKTLRSIASGR